VQPPSLPVKLINVGLGTAVAAVGFWLLWGAASPALLLAWIIAVAAFLWWAARTTSAVWAWATLVLGLESFAWPVVLMVQLRGGNGTPSDEEMGTVLAGVVLGVFSSVFWLSFSYGLFKRTWASDQETQHPITPEPAPRGRPARKR
jgi:hypothetical protein